MYEKTSVGEELSEEQHKICLQRSKSTAIYRKLPSAPTKYLIEKNLFPSSGRVLDYGCGKGTDLQELQKVLHQLEVVGYDPNYGFEELPEGKFDIIVCNFVLNVISDKKVRTAIVDHILSLLKDGGKAYISVRAHVKVLNGVQLRGTWQGFIELKFPIKYKTGTFIMYELEKI